MIRGCRAALGLVLVWFVLLGALTSTAAADVVPPASEGVVYGYDTAHRAASISPHAHDRDPAINYNRAAARLAVDHDPRGPSARLDAAGTYRYTPYDRSVALALVDSITCTAGRHAGAVDGELSPIQRSGVAANGADNVANGVRLGQQLARESAESAFTSSGRLSSGAIQESKQIVGGSSLKNTELIKRLTSDGSDVADWAKYTTRTYQSPSGNFQVHFYMNRGTGAIDYGYDYKTIFGGMPR